MEAPTEFTAESVRDYILSKGGKVTNHELVKHFKPFLTDPVMKGELQCFCIKFISCAVVTKVAHLNLWACTPTFMLTNLILMR